MYSPILIGQEVSCNSSESEIYNYFSTNEILDPIEGIWIHSYKEYQYFSDFEESNNNPAYRQVAIIKKSDSEFKVCEVMKPSKKNVRSRESIAKIDEGHYSWKSKIYFPYKSTSSSAALLNDNTIKSISSASQVEINYVFKSSILFKSKEKPYSVKFDNTFKRIFPEKDTDDYEEKNEIPFGTYLGNGTGFSIDKKGIIITNHHVIEGGGEFKIRGINGDFDKSYSAKVIDSDKEYDLAILKVADDLIESYIPYDILKVDKEVGNDVFVLGYPLLSSMGEEVKLTTGIISSNTGLLGSKSLYQISAPAQSGNSGGPVFDENGSLLGVITSKHKDADNATYIVKSTHLVDFMQKNNIISSLARDNEMNTKKLPDLVKAIKDFVYIIEVYK